MSKLFPAVFLVGVALIALLTAACETFEKASGPDETAGEVSDAELSEMVLDLGQFGPEYAGFTADGTGTGWMTIDSAARNAFDPADERVDLESYGYLSGYEEYFVGDGSAVGGAVYLGSEVALFATPNGAAEQVLETDRETTTHIGKTVDGATLVKAEKFNFDAGADDAVGIRGTLRVAHRGGTSTEVWVVAAEYQRGRLVGRVEIHAIGATELEKVRLQGKVEALASVMNARMTPLLNPPSPTEAAAAGGN
jgi:hypothetical protein